MQLEMCYDRRNLMERKISDVNQEFLSKGFKQQQWFSAFKVVSC